AREYTAPLAEMCVDLSGVICDPGVDGDWASARAIGRLLRGEQFDASLSLFSRFDTALGLALARIPVRVAPATKLAQVVYTRKLRQHRSRSAKPEYVYNLELTVFFLQTLGVEKPVWPKPPYLTVPVD